MKKVLWGGILLSGIIFFSYSSQKDDNKFTRVEETWEEDGVSLSVRVLTPEESKERLGVSSVKWGVQPVRITIDNQTEMSYRFSPESLDVPLWNATTVAKQLMKDAMPRSIGFKIAGFFFWPLSIPSAIDSLLTIKGYNLLQKKLLAQTVKDEVIPPYTKVHRIAFIPAKSYKENMMITLQEQEDLLDHRFLFEAGSSSFASALPVIQENYYVVHEEEPTA